MKEDILVIFDDTVEKSEPIRDIIGAKGFADVVVKKRKLESYYMEVLLNLYQQAGWRTIHSVFEFHNLLKDMDGRFDRNVKVLHCFSNFIISSKEKAALSLKKLPYIDEDYRVLCDSKIVGIMFESLDSYIKYLRVVCEELNSTEVAKRVGDFFCAEGFTDIGTINNFVQCVAGNFESRYFNSLTGNEYTLVKSSSDRKKIKSEYTYYQLLPEDMKFWFVQPFHYVETDQDASYTMERLHMTDLAVRWVHGSIDEEEFEELLDKYFYFFSLQTQQRSIGNCISEDI